MLDFIQICQGMKKGVIEIYPKFIIKKSNDLMIRGGDFYAIWDEEAGLWSTDEYKAQAMIDAEVDKWVKENGSVIDGKYRVLHIWDADSKIADKWHKYCSDQLSDNYHPLDEKLIFGNEKTKREDYASKRLKYPLKEGDISAYDKLMSVLYSPPEREKLEWAIGAVVSGDSKQIQKFIVMYGAAGTGKSTVLNIIQDLFDGYYSTFDAKALGNSNSTFALEAFKSNPLVAIQHDGDLSKIEDNTRLNSIVSHELMVVNEKFKSTYAMAFNSFLFLGTNSPVRITNSKSGILRRLIDVSPSGNRMSRQLYSTTMAQIKFELGAIAWHCLQVYEADPNKYDDYIPVSMLGASNDFYNYVLDSFDVFKSSDYITLKQAWEMYKTYCNDANVPYPYSMRVFKEELKSYFNEFKERSREDNLRNVYYGFKTDKFDYTPTNKIERAKGLRFDEETSLLDEECANCKAQYASGQETPIFKWDDVTTKLKDLDTHRLHYLRLPKDHIVIDFDLKDADGNKSFKKNTEAAAKWPPTYGELSKSGQGIHLHYIYDGDVNELARLYDKDIEIKVFTGKSSLRRKLTKCNNLPIATINTGLPMKGEKKMVNFDAVKSEKGLRASVMKNLNKEVHPATKPSVDFIYKILNDAYSSGLKYDITDMRPAVLAFAANSTNNSAYCIKLVNKMKFKSDEPSQSTMKYAKDDLIFYDVEVFPNLFVVVFKAADKPAVKMINPTPDDIEELIKFKLVGFNCRRYDNHILYARLMGYNNLQLYDLSQKIINGSKNAMFGEAYNISYTDVYDFCSKKQSLKKWEIELDIHHQELGLPWDQPVDESMWEKVADYCINDVVATEAVFNHQKGDWLAREILADVAGMTVNDTTNSLTTRIIFGKDRHPGLVYTDLATGERSDGTTGIGFPGYSFEQGEDGKWHNLYRGEDVGMGGYVYAEPGMYSGNIVTFDVASMHPSSIIAMNCFGEYTARFKEILDARIAIKHKDFDQAKKMLGGKLSKYLDDPNNAKALAQALKIAINSVYGLTSAAFENPFRDIRNKNNIVALRGALFMVTLRDEIQKMGFTVIHIKTDSIKVLNPTKELAKFIIDFGHSYGYNFEVEHVFDRICLVNNAVYIAKCAENDPDSPGLWEATGKQFQIPYIYKTLFSKEPIEFKDLCEGKEVTTALYLDMNEDLPEGEHNYVYIGRVGLMCPVKPGCGGGILLRIDKSGDKYSAATGSKGYRWMEAEMVKVLGKENDIDRSYYDRLVDEALASLNEFGDVEQFIS